VSECLSSALFSWLAGWLASCVSWLLSIGRLILLLSRAIKCQPQFGFPKSIPRARRALKGCLRDAHTQARLILLALTLVVGGARRRGRAGTMALWCSCALPVHCQCIGGALVALSWHFGGALVALWWRSRGKVSLAASLLLFCCGGAGGRVTVSGWRAARLHNGHMER